MTRTGGGVQLQLGSGVSESELLGLGWRGVSNRRLVSRRRNPLDGIGRLI